MRRGRSHSHGAAAGSALLIAQFSDPHLRPPGVLYQGLVDSNAMFEAALRHLAALSPAPDLVLLSGDVVDEGTAADYAVARGMLAGLRQPLLVIPGNHDEREAFRASFADRGYCPASGPLHAVADQHGPVRFIALDVTVPDAHHGVFDDAAARWLEAGMVMHLVPIGDFPGPLPFA